MKKLALVLLTFLYFLSANAHSGGGATPDFLVRPYLYSHTGDHIRLAWSYKNPPAADAEITGIFEDQFESKPLEIQRDAELYIAELPMAACGFGPNNTYFVTGMQTPEAITPIACPGELGTTSRFVFIADSQVDTKEGVLPLEYIVKQIQKNGGADAVVVGGDLVQTGDKFDLWTQFFETMNPMFKNTLLVPVMGNHEYHGNNKVPNWRHFFGVEAHDAMYSMVIGDAQIFAINSSFTDDPSLIEPERAWLEKALAASQDDPKIKWRIVTFHHPPYSKGIANSPLYPKKEFQVVQQKFVPLFEQYRVNLVLNGHVHLFERSEHNGVQYLITGPAAGKIGPYGGVNPYSVKADRIRTMATVEISARQLRVTTTDLEGNIVDEISLAGWR